MIRIVLISASIILNIVFTVAEGLIINEIQPAPESPEPEWVELYNHSSIEYRCDNCEIGDSRSLKAVEPFTLKAGGFILIADDAAALRASYSIPSDITVIELALPALNNGGDEVRLFNGTLMLDSISYSSSYDRGKTLERIFPDLPWGNDNWASVKDGVNGTPGNPNSNAIKAFDIELSDVIQTENKISLIYKNTGSESFTIEEIIIDSQINETNLNILPGDSATFDIDLPETDSYGYKSHSATVTVLSSENALESVTDSLFLYHTPDSDPIISEVMYDPDDNKCEFFEIFYSGEKPFDLNGILYGDASERNDLNSIDTALIIKSDSYIAFAADSTIYDYSNVGNVLILSDFPTLNNSGDEIILDYPIDNGKPPISIYFDGDMHDKRFNDTKGISLEIVDDGSGPEFRSSTDEFGSTPGTINSWSWIDELDSGITIEPNPFDETRPAEITYNLFEGTGYIRATIYDQTMISVFDLIEGRPGGGRGSASWDGRDRNGSRLPAGVYILIIEGVDDKTEKSTIKREVIIIGE
jgi:hypothetical protein